MLIKQEFSLIITIVHRGFSDSVVDIAKQSGAEGATILTGRGASIHETDTVLGVAIQPEKEMVLILVNKSLRKQVMRAINIHCGLGTEGRGICFSLPVEEVAGVNHIMKALLPKKSIIKSAVKAKGEKDNKKAKKSTENTKKISKNTPKI